MLIDTHCHLNDDAYKSDLDDVVIRMKENNVKAIVVGCDNISNQEAIRIRNKYHFPIALGIHPENVYDYDYASLEKLIMDNNPVAIGEIGLDYYWVKDNKDLQKKIFEEQVRLASILNLPIIVHSREAFLDTYEILKKYEGKVRGVIHGYSGSVEMAKNFISLGFYIGLGGVLTFKNAKQIKETAQEIPLSWILSETDSPYLTPVPKRGERNEPTNVMYVVDYLAMLRKEDREEVQKQLIQNAKELFRI